MNECPKCGNGQYGLMGIMGPVYDHDKDKLAYTCARCGYRTYADPLDKKRRASLSNSIRDFFSERRIGRQG